MKRERIIENLFNYTNEMYRNWKKREPWGVSVKKLLCYPENSIGKKLGEFLYINGFELLDKSETHDVFHVLTGYNTTVPDEIKMQFYLFGNGKKSLYMAAVLLSGIVFYPDLYHEFKKAYRRGQSAIPFHHLSYLPRLNKSLSLHQKQFNIQ